MAKGKISGIKLKLPVKMSMVNVMIRAIRKNLLSNNRMEASTSLTGSG